MLVDTADARRASIARMPGSQVVRKTERERAHERGRAGRQVSILLCLQTLLCVHVCVDGFRGIPVLLVGRRQRGSLSA